MSRGLLAGTGTALGLLVVSVLLTAPGWRPPPDVRPLDVAPVPEVALADRHLPYAAVDRSDAVTATGVRARVVRPRGAEGTLPGVVLVAGAGRADRDDLAEEAEALARGGLVVLTYDKRRDAGSVLAPGYGRLAVDALTALDLVAVQPAVDRGRVGLLGIGEGGWVVPLAADLSSRRVRLTGRPEPARVAFTVLVSAPVVSPLDQAAWAVDRHLDRAPDAVRAGAAAGLALGRPLLPYLGTDVRDGLAVAGRPTYAVWGGSDPTLPVAVAAERLRSATGGHSAVEVVGGGGHRVPIASGWAERVADWVRRGYPDDDRVRGAQPDVLVGLATLPRPRWFADPRLHLVLAALVALAAGCLPGRRPRLRSARSG